MEVEGGLALAAHLETRQADGLAQGHAVRGRDLGGGPQLAKQFQGFHFEA